MFEELSLHILDIAMHSLAAGARTVQIAVLESRRRDLLILRVRDDGCGMSEAELQRVLQSSRSGKPSRKKQRRLGLALLRQTSEMCGGHFQVRSAPGQATEVTAAMRWSHGDRPPLGDMGSTVLALCIANPTGDVQLSYRSDADDFHFSSQESTRSKKGSHELGTTQETQRESPAPSCVA